MRVSLLALRRFSLFLWPLLVALLCLFLYLSTLTNVHTFDALSYVLDVDRKPWQELFHPHHLAYGPLGALVRNLAHALGQAGSARMPLQITNALAGALGVALFFALLRDQTRRIDLAICGALLLGASYAYWYYAVEVEVYTIAALFLVLCLWLMARLLRQPTPGQWAALGLFQGLATLFHQTNVLLCVPVALVLLLSLRSTPAQPQTLPTKLRRLFVAGCWYALPLGLVVGGSYLTVGFGISGFRSWEQFVTWMTKYARTGWWGGPITNTKWADLGQGLTDTLAQPGGALLGLLLLGLLLFYLRALALAQRNLALCLGLWLLTYGAFFLWWEPDNIEFWIASLPPAILLLLLALGAGGPRWHPGVWVALAIGITALGLNYDAIVRRGMASYDLQRRIASLIATQSTPDDLLMVPDGLQELYLPYYEGRSNVFSLNQALFTSSGNWDSACAEVQARIKRTLESGIAVVIGAAVQQPEPRFLQRFGLTQAQVAACFAPYRSGLRQLAMGADLPGYDRLPSAQELADGEGWQFVGDSWGWRTQNISAARLENGWNLLPASDPALISPPLQIDTGRYQAIEVVMASSTQNRDAQLFFIDERGQTSEAHSVRWQLAPGDTLQTYRIELRGQPGWAGIVTGLRLDPVALGDGGWVRISSIRLLP